MRTTRFLFLGMCASIISTAQDARFLALPFSSSEVSIQQGWIYESGELHFPFGAIDFVNGLLDDSTTWESFSVLAAADGVAVWDDSTTSGYGNMVLVRHRQVDASGNHYFTLYGHLADNSIPAHIPKLGRHSKSYEQWAPVRSGDMVGRAGQTGYVRCVSDNCIHLHFELHIEEYFRFQTDPYGVYAKRKSYPGICEDHRWLNCPPTPPTPCEVWSDSFSRPNGPVGNGWTPTGGNVGGDLVVETERLSTPGPSGEAGIFRPVEFSGATTVSAAITEQSGFGGVLRRYDTSILFGNNGARTSGYGVRFTRGDVNFNDSAVRLVANGVELSSTTSSFQFGSSISVEVRYDPRGNAVAGTVSGDERTFTFSFPSIPVALSGGNLSIEMGFPDARSTVITNATVDDVSIESCP